MDLFTAYEPWQLVAALLAAFGSAFVRGLTGFGMAILLVPILALALTPLDAERSAWIIAGIVLLTAPLGFIALSLTTPGVARLIVALIAFSAFLAILLPRRPAAQPGMVATGGVGVVSGLMTGYAGMPGPPVVPYYVGRDLPRETAKASMMLIFTIAPFAGLATGAVLEVLDWQLALLALGLFPAVLVGNKLGDRASGRMPDAVWRTFVGVVLAGAALAAFLRLL